MKKFLAALLLAVLLSGCASAPRPTPPPQTTPETAPPAPSQCLDQPPSVFPTSSEEVYDGCATNGDVTALSDRGCVISECLLEDLENGTSLMTGAPPGMEDLFPSVEVRYGANCVFIRVEASLSTQEVRCQAVSSADVKEQTYVVVHGQTLADGTIEAETVYLYRVAA